MCALRRLAWITAPILVALLGSTVASAGENLERVPPAEFGEVFPATSHENLNAGAGGAAGIDLGRVIGKKPVILYYWIAGNRHSEEVFQELQALAEDLGPSKVLLYGVVTERPGLERDRIQERIRALKIHVPVLNDVGFRLGQRLVVRRVPSINVLDGEGRLRLANGGSLRQSIEYEMDVEAAIRRVASGKGLGTYGSLPRWYAVKELVGETCPDFEAPLVGEEGGARRWSEMLSSDAVNVLVFWSVDCPHCRSSLPPLSDWLEETSGVNLVGAAHVANEAIETKTVEFCSYQELAFPNFADRDRKIAEEYRVDSTPTYVIIRPDGVIDSVVVSGAVDMKKMLREKKEALLGGSSSATASTAGS